MIFPGKFPEHSYGVLGVLRLSEDPAPERNDRIRPQNDTVRETRRGGSGLISGDSGDMIGRSLSRQYRLIDVGRGYLEREPMFGQDLLPAGGGAGKNESAGCFAIHRSSSRP